MQKGPSHCFCETTPFILYLLFGWTIFLSTGTTGTASRAPNALCPTLFCLVNVPSRKAHYNSKNGDDNNICHSKHSLSRLLATQSILLLQALVGILDQVSNNGNDGHYGNQTRDKSGSHVAFGDEGTDLIDQIGHSIAGGEL